MTPDEAQVIREVEEQVRMMKPGGYLRIVRERLALLLGVVERARQGTFFVLPVGADHLARLDEPVESPAVQSPKEGLS